MLQVKVFHPWRRDDQQLVGKPQRQNQECLLPVRIFGCLLHRLLLVAATIHHISTTSRKIANLTNDDRQYSSLLTPYAYNLVLSQIALRDAANVSVDGTHVLSTKGPLFVTTSPCECAFQASYRLPCRHIFARRNGDVTALLEYT